LNVIEAKSDEGLKSQARAVLAVIRKMLNWAVQGDYVELNPLAGVSPVAKAARRERVLADNEVRAIWNALPDAAVSQSTADALRLLFLTGQRSGEVCGITRGEIDLDKALWSMPAIRVKNGLPHNVPLSRAALIIIKNRLAAADDGPDAPLFSRVGKPIESNAIAQATRKALQHFDQPWTPHDIRRTVATGMAEAGVFPHIVEAVLNHISGARAGVAGIYNRAAYDGDKRRALDLWADRLASIIEDKPSNIVPLKRGA
jgi:integrase